jgi:hypothetical protein
MLSLEVVYQVDPDLVVNINKRHVSPSRTSHRYSFVTLPPRDLSLHVQPPHGLSLPVLSAHLIVPMTRAPLTPLE